MSCCWLRDRQASRGWHCFCVGCLPACSHCCSISCLPMLTAGSQPACLAPRPACPSCVPACLPLLWPLALRPSLPFPALPFSLPPSPYSPKHLVQLPSSRGRRLLLLLGVRRRHRRRAASCRGRGQQKVGKNQGWGKAKGGNTHRPVTVTVTGRRDPIQCAAAGGKAGQGGDTSTQARMFEADAVFSFNPRTCGWCVCARQRRALTRQEPPAASKGPLPSPPLPSLPCPSIHSFFPPWSCSCSAGSDTHADTLHQTSSLPTCTPLLFCPSLNPPSLHPSLSSPPRLIGAWLIIVEVNNNQLEYQLTPAKHAPHSAQHRGPRGGLLLAVVQPVHRLRYRRYIGGRG